MELKRNNSSRVKMPPPSFYGLETEEQVARHLMNIDFEYDQAKTAKAVWFDVPYDEVESLPGYVSGAMGGAWGAMTGVAIIAGNRHSQSIRSTGHSEPAGRLKGFNTPESVNGRSKLLAHPETFRKGLYLVIAGSRKDPCIHIFNDGQEITADGIPTYGKGLSRVSWVLTTMDNDVDGKQLLAWQEERRDKRR